jgi:hypothetical protein
MSYFLTMYIYCLYMTELIMDTDPDVDKKDVRRPMNAFLIFCKRHRSMVRERNSHLDNSTRYRYIQGDPQTKKRGTTGICKCGCWRPEPGHRSPLHSAATTSRGCLVQVLHTLAQLTNTLASTNTKQSTHNSLFTCCLEPAQLTNTSTNTNTK